MLLVLFALLLLTSGAVAAQQRTNIIVVFVDDMGWADLSCFGNPDAKTPHIDRLAEEGLAFEHFYVNSPICSPSRVAISTGQYPQRYGITSYLAHRKGNTERGQSQWLDPEAPMLARTLQASGYATGHFGKWHMGGQRDVDDAPPISDYGFDASLTNFEGMGPKLLPLTKFKAKDGTVKTGRIWAGAERLGGPVTWMQRSEITGGFVEAAISFIDRSMEQDKPFYINVWPDDVHSPFYPPIEKWGPTKRDLYHAVLEEMDRQLGVLFDRIREDESLRGNTLILFCSDNGPELDAGRAGKFKGYKTHLYEGGIRSPLIVWGPGLVNAEATGTRNRQSVFSAMDLVPTLVSITGSKKDHDHQYDGEDLRETLLGSSNKSRVEPIFFSRPPDRKNYYGFKDLPDLAVRQGRWKLLCDYDGGRAQLFDLSKDPGETRDVAEQNQTLVEGLKNKTVAWYRELSK